ncbi:MAG: adenylate/guanylate cyclase domain-containing protein [Deltaproteobacteria bacterium]|nr:adenylate/guanylate cyclase domain-containing protein [Deltaproteobacteria bacterium]
MKAGSPKRRLAAILSADAAGYSRLMAQDEVATLRTLEAHRGAMAALVRQHGGRVVDAVGDNLLAEFGSVVDAVSSAVAIQAEIAARNGRLPESRRLPFRIGVNVGEVIVDGERIAGDGVNVAARIEALAGPGEVWLSAAAFQQVEGKLELDYDDMGERPLKNLPRPLRVYRARARPQPEGGAASGEAGEGAAALSVAGFAGRPAIAVLPFASLGGDPAQPDHFAEGLAEDLTMRLSRWRLFPVISRGSTLAYRGRPVDPRQVSRELGVRYVIEGSVRRAGKRIRVGCELVDAPSGRQLWAERYDRELEDIFAVQDEIVDAVAAAIEPALRTGGGAAPLGHEPRASLDAWESFQRGWAQLHRATGKADADRAIALFRRARELDPSFSTAFAAEAAGHCVSILYQWTDSPAEAAEEARRAAQRGIELDEADPWAQLALGVVSAFAGDLARAVPAFERAIELNPSLTMAYQGLGVALSAERPDEAIRILEKGIRLSPRDPFLYLFHHQIAVAHMMAGRYEEAIAAEEQSVRLRADQPHLYRVLGACYGYLGRADRARAALDEMLRLSPRFSIDALRLSNSPALVERYLEGWRRAGWTPP